MRRAPSVDSVAAGDLLVLDKAGSDCGGTEMAVGETLSVTDAQSLG